MSPRGAAVVRPRGRMPAGFTIIEVLVSVMLLSLSVVSIFGAQFAAVATTDFARYTTQAIQLAECRMSEIELQVLTEGGFEEGDVTSSGACCEMMEDEESSREFNCNWEIKTIELPDITTLLSGGGADGGLGGGFLEGMGEGMGESGGDLDMLGAISSFAPMISEMLKAGIRRVTVKVEWTQGVRERELVLSQYIVHPTQGPLELMNAAADMAEQIESVEGAGDEGGGLPSAILTPGGGE